MEKRGSELIWRWRLRWERAAVLIALALTAAASAIQATAQEFPSKVVRLVVPYAAGGGVDVLARIIAVGLTERWGKQVVVDNRPGADGVIGTETVARSEPDGHTLLLQTPGHIIIPHLIAKENRKLPYDPLNDFSPITNIASAPFALVIPASLPVTSVKELIGQCKAKPGTCTWGSAEGSGQMAGELFRTMAGLQMVHVRYKGTGQIIIDLLGAHLMIGFSAPTGPLPHVKSGKLKFLAVGGSRRAEILPDVPTMAEAGLPGYEAYVWWGLFAPAGASTRILNKIRDDTLQVTSRPDVRSRIAELGAEIVGNSPSEFAAALRDESKTWARLAKESAQ